MLKTVEKKIKITPTLVNCDCLDWSISWPQIEKLQVKSFLEGTTYSGSVFNFCPWCGNKIK